MAEQGTPQMIKTLARRLERLKQRVSPTTGRPRVIVRFRGPGSEELPQLNEDEIDENTTVITVTSVAAKDGKPVESLS